MKIKMEDSEPKVRQTKAFTDLPTKHQIWWLEPQWVRVDEDTHTYSKVMKVFYTNLSYIDGILTTKAYRKPLCKTYETFMGILPIELHPSAHRHSRDGKNSTWTIW